MTIAKIASFLLLLLLLAACQVGEREVASPPEQAIESRVVTTDSKDLILIQEVLVDAPVGRVWQAYTTEEGWKSWASPAVEIDLRTGGTIRSHYGADAKIGDPGTNTIHILNFVPQRLLTLQAEVEDRWPDVMKQDAEHLMNVIVFDSIAAGRTKISSYGVGYKDTEAYAQLMEFFIPANEGLFEALKKYLEK